eukprot:6492764-Amphidinium_carterae.1
MLNLTAKNPEGVFATLDDEQSEMLPSSLLAVAEVFLSYVFDDDEDDAPIKDEYLSIASCLVSLVMGDMATHLSETQKSEADRIHLQQQTVEAWRDAGQTLMAAKESEEEDSMTALKAEAPVFGKLTCHAEKLKEKEPLPSWFDTVEGTIKDIVTFAEATVKAFMVKVEEQLDAFDSQKGTDWSAKLAASPSFKDVVAAAKPLLDNVKELDDLVMMGLKELLCQNLVSESLRRLKLEAVKLLNPEEYTHFVSAMLCKGCL